MEESCAAAKNAWHLRARQECVKGRGALCMSRVMWSLRAECTYRSLAAYGSASCLLRSLLAPKCRRLGRPGVSAEARRPMRSEVVDSAGVVLEKEHMGTPNCFCASASLSSCRAVVGSVSVVAVSWCSHPPLLLPGDDRVQRRRAGVALLLLLLFPLRLLPAR